MVCGLKDGGFAAGRAVGPGAAGTKTVQSVRNVRVACRRKPPTPRRKPGLTDRKSFMPRIAYLKRGRVGCKGVAEGKEGRLARPSAERKDTGLGSSHTVPCGAAVPARPPTRCATLW